MITILSWLQGALSHIGPFVILLGLLIFVHELGHFLVAKFFGVRVEVFSLGFGKKILQVKRGDTTYCVSWIPLGGYVKMFGDDPTAEVSAADKPYSFLHKPVGQRIGIVLAGPLMNLFFAMFLYAAIALLGEQLPAAIVGDLDQASVAHQTGFRPGDEILKINGKEIKSWVDVRKTIEESANRKLELLVKRSGEEAEVTITATPQAAPPDNILSAKSFVGTISGLTPEALSSVIGIKDPQSLAAKSGLKALDQFISVDGKALDFFRDLEPEFNRILASGRTSVEVEVRSILDENAEARKINLELSRSLPNESILESIGIESGELYLYKIKPGSPADQAGLLPADKLIAVNSESIHSWQDVVERVKKFEASEGPLEFSVLRSGEALRLTLAPEMTSLMTQDGKEDKRFTVGIVSGYLHTTAAPVLISTSNPLEAIHRGIFKSFEVSGMIAVGLAKLVQGEISSKNVGGVITIGRFASKSFQVGLTSFLAMMAFISLNLFLVNLLPVPILDGGHLVFFTIEAIRGAPLSMRKMEIAQQVGLVLLMSLMAFALFNDITNLFNSW